MKGRRHCRVEKGRGEEEDDCDSDDGFERDSAAATATIDKKKNGGALPCPIPDPAFCAPKPPHPPSPLDKLLEASGAISAFLRDGPGDAKPLAVASGFFVHLPPLDHHHHHRQRHRQKPGQKQQQQQRPAKPQRQNQGRKRPSTPPRWFASCASVAIPNPEAVFHGRGGAGDDGGTSDVPMPYLFFGGNGGGGTEEEKEEGSVGATARATWPFVYVGDVVNAATGKRAFVRMDLAAVDWVSGLALFRVVANDSDGGDSGGRFVAPRSLPLARSAPPEGARIFAWTDAQGTGPTTWSSGTVLRQSLQPSALLAPRFVTDLSRNRASAGAPIVDPAQLAVVGVRIDTFMPDDGGGLLTADMGLKETRRALQLMARSVERLDQTSSSGNNDVRGGWIVVAVPRKILGGSASYERLESLRLANVLPPAHGYVFDGALPVTGLQSRLKSGDMIVRVGRVDVGAGEGNAEMSEAIDAAVRRQGAQTNTSSVDVTILPLSQGGFTKAPRVLEAVPLSDDVDDGWRWWFRWCLPAAGRILVPRSSDSGSGSSGTALSTALSDERLADAVVAYESVRPVRPSDQEIEELGAGLLTTRSTAGAQSVAENEESQRVRAIVYQVQGALELYGRAADTLAHWGRT